MRRISVRERLLKVLDAPFTVWVLLGFSFSYLLYFLYPIFLSGREMRFFEYLPAMKPIGLDLRQMLQYSASLFVPGQGPYIVNLYPPLASVLFAPLLLVPPDWAYRIFVLFDVICYAVMTLVIPLRISKERPISSILMLVFITGSLSYGLQFEIERGQWNLIAVFMAFLAIWIFHYHPKYRFLAYVLFTISVQLKVFPLIFIFMLVHDWRAWRSNAKRLGILGVVNLALLLVLGPFVFANWVSALTSFGGSPYIWVGNVSIMSFVTLVFHSATESGLLWASPYSGATQLVLLVLVLACPLLIIIQAYRKERSGLNPHLLLACTIVSLLLPSVSHDYKLSYLAASVAILLSAGGFPETASSHRQHVVLSVLTLVFFGAYSSTLFSYENKPHLIQNNLPALFVMLLITTLVSFMGSVSTRNKSPERHRAAPTP